MATIDWPTSRAFRGATFTLGLDTSESGFVGFHTGNRQRYSHAADRLRGVLTLPPTASAADGALRESFLLGWRSTGDLVRMGMPHRPQPLGSLRGSPQLSASVAAGARSLQLSGCTAGANVFTPAVLSQQWLDGWTTTNATVTYNSVAGPVAGSLATTVTRTATGNHLIDRAFTFASTSLRSLKFDVWLKAGTYTGNVRIIIADGADGNQIIKTVSLTAGWVQEFVAGSFPVSPAANIKVYIDPVDDSGVAGETFFVWFAGLQVEQALMGNAYIIQNAESAPVGQAGAADHLVRVATGDHFTYRTVLRSVAAGEVWTYSCWMRLVSLTGTVLLTLQNSAGTTIQSATHTVTSSWQRFSVTGTFASSASGVRGLINPSNNSGSAGDLLAIYGEQMEPGSVPTSYSPLATLNGGDFVQAGNELLMVGAAGATGNLVGAMTVPLALPLPKALTSGTVIVPSNPTGLWELDDDGLQLDYSAPMVQGGVAIPIRQVVQ